MRYFLLFLFGIESLDTSFEYKLPGLPYTIGKVAFILYGITGILSIGIDKLEKMLRVPLLIVTGFIIGGFINGSFKTEIACVPYYISLTVMAFDLRKLKFRKCFHWVMVMIFSYRVIYIVITVFNNFEYNSYSLLLLYDLSVHHPHVVGIQLSISSIYLIVYSAIKNNKLTSYFITLITIGLIILLESRHNFIAYSVTILAFLMYLDFKKSIKLLPIPIIIIFVYFKLSPTFERTQERFDIRNTEYQMRTTEARANVLKQFPKQFADKLMGVGMRSIRIDYGQGYEMTPHNQYISVAYAGGILSISALMLLIITSSKKTLSNMKHKYLIENELPLIFVLFNLMVTLFFIEFWGIIWFIFLAMFIYFNSRKINFAINEI